MPTENRSSETTECQFHNNCGGWCETPREQEHNLCADCLEAHDEDLRAKAAPATNEGDTVEGELKMLDFALSFALCNMDHAGTRRDVKKAQESLERLRKLLAAQPQEEVSTCSHEWTDDGEWQLICTKCGAQENHEPYGWVQTRGPAINQFTQEWDVVQDWEAQGFEYKAMHDHPAPADAEEVERLRAEVKRLDLLVAQADYSYDHDRANFQRQLAERDGLLKSLRKAQQRLIETTEEFCVRHGASFGHFDAARRNIKAIDAALSASAEQEVKS